MQQALPLISKVFDEILEIGTRRRSRRYGSSRYQPPQQKIAQVLAIGICATIVPQSSLNSPMRTQEIEEHLHALGQGIGSADVHCVKCFVGILRYLRK